MRITSGGDGSWLADVIAASTRLIAPATLAAPMALEYNPPRKQPRRVRDDVAYVLPMGLFLVFTWIGGTWSATYPVTYVVKVALVAAALIVLWRHYTPISWRFWWLGVIVGVIGIVQWVGMQLWLQRDFDFFDPS